jgi:hypothetical protein
MVAARRGDWVGVVSLAGARNSAWVLVTCIVLFVLFCALLVFGHYTRRVSIHGRLSIEEVTQNSPKVISANDQPLRRLGSEAQMAQLIALLYVPSSQVGFLRIGQPVPLRYYAFPYQKFGIQWGEVLSIALLDKDKAAVSDPDGMFEVKVQLSNQTIELYGTPTQLRPGMRFDADLLLERRTLFEWVFEPFYSIKARLATKK